MSIVSLAIIRLSCPRDKLVVKAQCCGSAMRKSYSMKGVAITSYRRAFLDAKMTLDNRKTMVIREVCPGHSQSLVIIGIAVVSSKLYQRMLYDTDMVTSRTFF
jgi:hypothetical protein